ncbi:zymogen granule membrane protein 16-like [Lampris incognitus]|uniref:zymogen granule membrane protein 16-like n=1 Tax=Lampris incognitus TaxID=2546036 RepID=UPI0024B60A14|nr:zymogen granule membrane protein 16-like [Lampris incognitus]
MFSPLCLTVLLATAWATRPTGPLYSFSPAVGHGAGVGYVLQGDERITAIRVWENFNSYITGLQVRYGQTWSSLVGRRLGSMQTIQLFEGEAIIQLSGKFHSSNYIYQVNFVTSRGRSFTVGQPLGFSFNLYPNYPKSELRFLSGRKNSNGITSIAAHWGIVDTNSSPPNRTL